MFKRKLYLVNKAVLWYPEPPASSPPGDEELLCSTPSIQEVVRGLTQEVDDESHLEAKHRITSV